MRAPRTLVAALGLTLAASAAQAQGIIETVAGGGPGDGSPALAVNLRTPQDVVRDAAGNTYVAVSDDRRVYRIGTDGNIALVAGSGGAGTSGDGAPAIKAELVSPKGLAFDTDGSLLIADEGGRRVRRVDLASGTISTLVGGGSLSGEGIAALQIALDAPRDVAVATGGDVFFADGHRIRKLDRVTGLVTTVAGTGTAGFSDGSLATSRRLNEPRALAFDPSGAILIADGGNGRIRKLVLTTDTISTLVSGICSPGGVAVDAAGVVYFNSNTGGCGGNAQKYQKWVSGSVSTIGSTGSNFVAQMSVLAGGTLLVADRDNFRAKTVSPSGTGTNVAGNGTIGYYGGGVPALSASMLSPTHVRADAAGNIYVYDNTNQIRRVNTAGIEGTLVSAGNCGSDPKAFLCAVEGLALLPGGSLAISDSKDHRLRKVDPATGLVTDVTTATLGRPRGIASSASGFVYVADRGTGNNNGAIRKVNATTGAMTVVASSLQRPQYIAVDGADNVYFTGSGGSAILRILSGGSSASTYVTLTSAVTGLDADAAGNVFASDSNNQVWKIAAGTSSLYAGSGIQGLGDGGSPLAASLSGPGGLSIVGTDLYIADALNYRIRRVRANRAPTADAGSDQTLEATSPVGATVSLNGDASSDPDGDSLTFTWSGPFGSASGSSASVTLPLGTHTITLSVSDGQMSGVDTLSVTVQDTIGPHISVVRSPLPNANGWNNTDVTLTFTCSDSGSGAQLAAPPAPEIVTHEGAGQSRTFECSDAAGNHASLTESNINIDKTAPVVMGVRSPLANVHGWNNTDVTVGVSATDGLSGVESCEPDVVLTVEGASQSATRACTDLAGNTASATVFQIHIDKTAPTLIFDGASPAANSHGWNNTDVTFAFAASDGLSGVDGTSVPSPLVLSAEGDSVSGSVDVTDLAGNTASFTSPVVRIDKTAPVVIGSRIPLANAHGWNNTDVTVSVSATDALSGVESCDADLTLSAEGATQSATRTCIDLAGNTASATVSDINIDKTAPIPSATPSPAANAHGWNNTDVTVTFAATDGLSGVESCDPAVVLAGEGAAQSASGSCDDLAGNTASATVSEINIDKTTPSLTFGAASPVANLHGWNNTEVSFAFSTSDNLSGVDTTSVPSPLVLSAEGDSVSGSIDVTDLAGNTASFTSPVVRIDKTAPVVTGSRTPLANAHGWNNTDVTVSVSATDVLSGLETCEPDVVVSAEGAGQAASRSCTDRAGNSASATISEINIDKTAPSVTGNPARPADKNGWYNHAVSVSWSGLDALSGVLSCDSASTYAGPDSISASVPGQCSDRAGNQGSGSFTLQYDATAPTVSIVTPPSGAQYTLNQSVTAQYSCGDNLSGVDTCAGPVANGAAVATAPVGAKTFQVTAMDAAGNTGSATNAYSVQYKFVGFLQPVDNLPTVNLANAGRTIPIKWQLKDAGGSSVADLSSVVSLLAAPLACDAAPVDIVEEETVATGGTQLRYDGLAGQYIFNWSTQKSWAGTCAQIQLTLADGTRQYAKFKLK